jgi:hypothetical protein
MRPYNIRVFGVGDGLATSDVRAVAKDMGDTCCRKLHVHSRNAAVVKALREGLI